MLEDHRGRHARDGRRHHGSVKFGTEAFSSPFFGFTQGNGVRGPTSVTELGSRQVVTSRATPRFWTAYRELPPDVRELVRKAYAPLGRDPQHPSLNFKSIHGHEPIYSVRVTRGYRATGLLEDNEITWFWIGNHAAYDQLLDHLR